MLVGSMRRRCVYRRVEVVSWLCRLVRRVSRSGGEVSYTMRFGEGERGI
jgi:hypothetical protein